MEKGDKKKGGPGTTSLFVKKKARKREKKSPQR